MEHFGPAHLTIIVAVVAIAVLAAMVPRHHPAACRRSVGILGGGLVLAAWATIQVANLNNGFTAARDLPLHLSDWAVLVTVVALVSRHPLAVELIWFWGLAGASWAILTPDIAGDLSDPITWCFFIAHGGAVVAALHLVLGCGIHPARGAVLRAIIASVAVAAVAGAADALTGGNYMFLRKPPARGSLLDVMGPWPWYIGSAALLAVVLFIALDAPFRRWNTRRDPSP